MSARAAVITQKAIDVLWQRLMPVEDWILFASNGDHWIRAVDIGERAGKAAPRHTRGIVKKAIDDGALIIVRAPSEGPPNSGRATPAVPDPQNIASSDVPMVRVEKLLVAKGNGATQEVDELYLARHCDSDGRVLLRLVDFTRQARTSEGRAEAALTRLREMRLLD